MSDAGKRKDHPSEDPAVTEPDVKKPKIESPDDSVSSETADQQETINKEPKPANAGKKSKKKSLRAKYDALEAGTDEAPEPKEDGGNPDDDDDAEEEYEDHESEEGEVRDDSEDDDDDDDEFGEDVEEDLEELSEPEVEPGSRRRRQPVDYAKVLAELEAEEKARKAEKS